MMHVLMIGISPRFGGTEAVIYSMLNEWKKNGIIVDFINAFREPLANEQQLRSLGSQIFPLNLRRRGRCREYRQSIRSFFQKHQNQFDAVFLNIQEPANATLLVEAKKAGIQKRIVLAHSAASPQGVSKVRRFVNWFSKKILSRYATKRVGVSSLARLYAYGTKQTSIVIRSGIDLDHFAFSLSRRQMIRKQLDIDDTVSLFSFVGRLTEEKNPHFLFDVFEAIHKRRSKARFLIVGDGDLADALKERVSKSALNGCINFVGHQTDTAPWMDASDYFLLPSNHEGMGMSLIEAQFSGLVCFASDGSIPKEAKITNLLTWISLKNSANYWAETMLNTPKNHNRQARKLLIDESDLNAKCVANNYVEKVFDIEH